jgi:galactokinase
VRLVAAPDLTDAVSALFRTAHGRSPSAVGRAPGRVNLIGEHTDYNAGLCLPIALPHATYAAVAPRADRRVRVVSAQADTAWEGEAADATGWAGYAAGVVWALREAGVDVPGVDLAIDSSVPVGAGLSSSAALECAVGAALTVLVGPLDPDALVTAAIRAETELVGAPTGGMDQTVAVHARAGHALLLDFASGDRTPVAWEPDGLRLLVVDTRVGHALVDGEYAERRRACEEAARVLGVPTLRGATPESLEGRTESWVRRARHVVGENARVLAFAEAARQRDWPAAGRLMTASHASLHDDYEVSCPELDVAVDAALAAGALGARLTGGGFGGCAIALVPDNALEEVADAVSAAFAAHAWGTPAYLLAEASGGAGPSLR